MITDPKYREQGLMPAHLPQVSVFLEIFQASFMEGIRIRLPELGKPNVN
jgi:hypothetical protein